MTNFGIVCLLIAAASLLVVPMLRRDGFTWREVWGWPW